MMRNAVISAALFLGLSSIAHASFFEFTLVIEEEGSGAPYDVVEHQLHTKKTDSIDPAEFTSMLEPVPSGTYTMNPIPGQPGKYLMSIEMGQWTSAQSFFLNVSHSVFCDSVFELVTANIFANMELRVSGSNTTAGCRDKDENTVEVEVTVDENDPENNTWESYSWDCTQSMSTADKNGKRFAFSLFLNRFTGGQVKPGDFCIDFADGCANIPGKSGWCHPVDFNVRPKTTKTSGNIAVGIDKWDDPTPDNPNRRMCKAKAVVTQTGTVEISATGCMCF